MFAKCSPPSLELESESSLHNSFIARCDEGSSFYFEGEGNQPLYVSSCCTYSI